MAFKRQLSLQNLPTQLALFVAVIVDIDLSAPMKSGTSSIENAYWPTLLAADSDKVSLADQVNIDFLTMSLQKLISTANSQEIMSNPVSLALVEDAIFNITGETVTENSNPLLQYRPVPPEATINTLSSNLSVSVLSQENFLAIGLNSNANYATLGSDINSPHIPTANSLEPFPASSALSSALPPLFTNNADNVDFSTVTAGSYEDGTQYDALEGDDTVVLPANAPEATQSGYTIGTPFISGPGNDDVQGGDLDDTIEGNAGNDTLKGGAGNDVLNGGMGDDDIRGQGGADILNGEEGVDTIRGGGGADILNGGDDADDLRGGGGADILNGDEGGDVLRGNNGDDTLNGGDGADDLRGQADNDTLNGDEDDDILDGGEGTNNLDGGTGTDTVTYDFASGAVTVNLATNSASGPSISDMLTNLENIIGSDFADSLRGNGSANEISGGMEDDDIRGRGGADILNGEDGMDTIRGGGGRDTLNGGEDADDLRGGAGADTLNGDEGDDILTGGSQADSFNYQDFSVDGHDSITDFGVGTGSNNDIIDLSVALTDAGLGNTDVTLTQAGADVIVGITGFGGVFSITIENLSTAQLEVGTDGFGIISLL